MIHLLEMNLERIHKLLKNGVNIWNFLSLMRNKSSQSVETKSNVLIGILAQVKQTEENFKKFLESRG